MEKLNTCNLWKYGPDAAEAWSRYARDGDTGGLIRVIADRMEKMRPQLLRYVFITVLVSADR